MSNKVKEDSNKGTPSSFASISDPWHHPEVSVTITALDIKTGVIEERVLSKQETKTFQAVVPESNYVAVKGPRTDFTVIGISFFLVTSCYVIGVPLATLLKKKN